MKSIFNQFRKENSKLEKKAVSGIMLALLLIGMLTLAFNIQPVKAGETVYIRADGGVDPDTAPISSVDNVTYTFTDNIYDEIVVERNNIVVDGNGYTLQGQGIGCGFYLDSINNVTIKRTLIKRFLRGIMLNSSSFNIVSENNITDNFDGVDLSWSSNNTISGNDITNNGWGVTLHSSSNNTIITNNITKHLYASESTPVGVQLFLSSNNTISGNNITNNHSGVHLHKSSFNTISGNDITNNPYRSLYLSESFNNTIYRNSITNNGYSVFLDSSYFNIVSENNIINNSYGVALYWSSNNNVVSGNDIKNNSYGVGILGGIQVKDGLRRLYLSSNSTISGNNITNNHLGVTLYLSSNNIIYHNNFINNTQQVYDYSWDFPDFLPSINSWDRDYPSGGNHWSDYTGVDLYSGPYQNETGNDGIGDAPYDVDVNNQDNYPLMGIFSDFNVYTRALGLGKVAGDKILNASANMVYFIYADPLYMTRAEAAYDVASGEIVRSLCANTQRYGFNTTTYWLLPSGAINTTTIHNATVAMFGSRCPNVAVDYYENVKELTPVKFKANDTYLWFENRTGATLGLLRWSVIKAPNYHEDMFTVMVFYDGDSDNTFLFVYGMDWKGTWAGGIYFKEVMSENLSIYTNDYYVFHWIDDHEQDGVPQSHEIHQEAFG